MTQQGEKTIITDWGETGRGKERSASSTGFPGGVTWDRAQALWGNQETGKGKKENDGSVKVVVRGLLENVERREVRASSEDYWKL